MLSPITPLAASNSTGGGLQTPKTQTEATSSSLDYDNFLQLLVTQLKNQDPLSPMEDTEYVAQLATFSNVEQNIITNERLARLETLSTLGSAQNLIGHDVKPADGAAGTVKEVKVTSEGAYAVLTDGREVPLGAGLTIS
jgi:flagellar basal-body rod modification protein FlgD